MQYIFRSRNYDFICSRQQNFSNKLLQQFETENLMQINEINMCQITTFKRYTVYKNFAIRPEKNRKY